MAADATPRGRVYQTRHQVVIGWVGALATMATGTGVLLLPTDHRQGGYVIATAAFLVALIMVRFAMCGVRVTTRGVRVTNLLRTTDLVWE